MRYAKDEFGNLKMNNPEYRKKVEKAWEDYYGNGANHEIVDIV